MQRVYQCEKCTLKVRVTNKAAYTLYHDVLGYTNMGEDVDYYNDGENAFIMELNFDPKNKEESKTEESVPEGSSTFDQYAQENPKAVGNSLQNATLYEP